MTYRLPRLACATSALALAALAPVAGAQVSTGETDTPQPAGAQVVAATAAGTSRPLQLAEDSPFRDPDIVYLEADELVSDEAGQTLTAVGNVVGRYQDRTLRAESVIYNLETGAIFAEGSVVITDPTGQSQFADKIELTGELQSGTATNFTLRTVDGGLTAAALAVRNPDESIELYNAYYTACPICASDPHPTWRLKARRVQQDLDNNAILYRDAVFELAGLPILYLPYFAHPDPSANRATGLLTPLVGITNDKGLFARVPYFVAVDPYTDLTATARLHQNVNPVLEIDVERQFATGTFNLETSLTYASIFDRDGNAFTDPDIFLDPSSAPTGRRLRSHTFADGRFHPSQNWTYGFGVELTSDDLYLERYDFDRTPNTRGLYNSDGLRLINQAYLVGQDDDFRFSVSAFGFQSLRSIIREFDDGPFEGQFIFSGEDDGILPIVHPRVDVRKFFDVAGTRVEAFGDAVYLTREKGTDYGRASAGLRWDDTFVAPGGIEVQPFAMGRVDQFDIDPDLDELVELDRRADTIDPTLPIATNESRTFSRTLGLAGVDVRYPFIRPGGAGGVDLIVEPRAQLTYSAGDAKLDRFRATNAFGEDVTLFQDSLSVDLDTTLLWDANKSTGYDFWQEATRLDAGATVAARWDDNEISLFGGKSWADVRGADFDNTSGLSGDTSDLVAEARANFGSVLRARVRTRFDDEASELRRIDADAFMNIDGFQANARYYRIQGDSVLTDLDPSAPTESASGGVRWRMFGDFYGSYRLNYDLTLNEPVRQDFGLLFDDECTRIELIYTRDRNDRGTVGDQDGLVVRIQLATLGGVG